VPIIPLITRVFVLIVFFIFALAFFGQTILFAREFWRTDWFEIASTTSTVFVFFPTFGIIALVAFYLPTSLLVDMYAYFQRGKLRSWLGRFADADRDFTSAIRYRHFILPIPVVIAKFVPGVEESVRNSLEALRLAGEDSYLRRALVRRKLGHWQGVLEDLQQQSHNLLIVPTLKAEALLQLGRSEEAMTTALAAEERFRETADIYAYDEIEAEAEKPGERDSKRADLLEIAATAADRMGQADRARNLIVACRSALEKVLSAQPGNQAVRGRLSRLGQEPKHAN
jgi:tetratricopeptide (TPR) repeat protein